jgi:hypothetical protein
MISRKDTE